MGIIFDTLTIIAIERGYESLDIRDANKGLTSAERWVS